MATLDDYINTIPLKKRKKLDMKLDHEHEGVQKHLGTIADSMDAEWEGKVAECLELTPPVIEEIKIDNDKSVQLQK